MTVIAWDGRSVAADKLANDNETKMTTTKLERLPNGDVLACCGSQWMSQMMASWYKAGANPKEWPEFPKDSDPDQDGARLIVIRYGKAVVYSHKAPIAIEVEDDFYAWGCGQDYALGAMAMGATAKQAVEIASRYRVSCGLGVDVYEIEQSAKLEAV